MADDPIRILTFTSLFPNQVQTRHGVFVAERLRQLQASGAVRARVVAPVPYFPSWLRGIGRYGALAAIAAHEQHDGMRVEHPRYPVIPKVGMSVAPLLMAMATRAAVARSAGDGFAPALIDAHYFYPDGVAAALIGARLGLPVVITARGSDLNLLPDYPVPRRWIRWAAHRAAALITVSEALKARLQALGVPGERVTVLRNGVDLDTFRPLDREALRRDLDIGGPTLLSVGNLLAVKRHHLVIEALGRLPGVRLLIAGQGPLRHDLQALAQRLGVQDRVRFCGEVSRPDLIGLYNAADCLVLASQREGMPNVVLEALACGTPVVASDVGGVAEVVQSPDAGMVVQCRDADTLAGAIARLLAEPPARDAVRRHAGRLGWSSTVSGQVALYRTVAGAGAIT